MYSNSEKEAARTLGKHGQARAGSETWSTVCGGSDLVASEAKRTEKKTSNDNTNNNDEQAERLNVREREKEPLKKRAKKEIERDGWPEKNENISKRQRRQTHPLRQARDARADHAERRLGVVGGELDDRRQPEEDPFSRPDLLVGLLARVVLRTRATAQENTWYDMYNLRWNWCVGSPLHMVQRSRAPCLSGEGIISIIVNVF